MNGLRAVVCGITLIALAGCGASETQSISTPVSLADSPPLIVEDAGQSQFKRIAALASGSSDVLISLGLTQNVVGVSATETRPELSAAPTISPAHSVNIEQILVAEPDLILLDEGSANAAELEQLQSQGAEVLVLKPSFSANEMFAKIRSIGSKLGLTREAEDIVTQLALPANGNVEGRTKPRVAFLYLRGNNAIYLIGGTGSGADQLLDMAGAIDAGSETLNDPFTPLSAESIAKLNPDALLVMTKGLESVGGISGLLALPGVAQTSAGKQQQVIVVEDQLLLSFSTRTPALVEQLRARLKLLAPPASY